MIADRYYYEKLTEREKQVYRDFYQGIKNCESVIRTITFPNVEKSMGDIYSAIIADNPHIYYLDQTRIHYSYGPSKVEIYPSYLLTKSQIDEYNQKIQQTANQIVSNIIMMAEDNELKREKALYEYLAYSCRYDKNALHSKEPFTICKAHSLLGVFFEGKAVCEGFAKAFKFLMNAMDMKCIIVNGHAGSGPDSGHTWNIVKINNKSYHVDVTWAVSRNQGGTVWYDYLNLSDHEIALDHSGFSGVPKCSFDDLDYYKTVAPRFDNLNSLKNHIKDCLINKKEVTTFRLLKGTGAAGFRDLHNSADLVAKAVKLAHQEIAGFGFKYDMRYTDERHIFIVTFEY